MGKTNYSGFMILLLIVVATIFLVLYNPNKNVTYPTPKEESPYSELKLESDSDVLSYLIGWQAQTPITAHSRVDGNFITKEQYMNITTYIERSEDKYRDYNDEIKAKNIESANNSLYFSFWNIIYADELTSFYSLNNCANEVKKTSDKFHPFLYTLRYDYLQSVNKYKDDAERFSNIINLETHNTPESISAVINNIDMYRRSERDFDNSYINCIEFREEFTENYNFQKRLFYVKIVFIIISLIIVFILGKILTTKNLFDSLEAIITAKNKLTFFTESIFSPKKIKTETIETILKLSSVAATMAALAAFFGKSNILFAGTAIVCVFILLISILFGIVSINSGKFTRWCYGLFITGIILFIGVVIIISILALTSLLLDNAKQSVVDFFTNSTR